MPAACQPTADVLTQAKLYLSVARYELAERTLLTYLDGSELPDHEYADLHNMLGFVYHQQSKFDEAVAQYGLATEYDPAHLEALLSHVVCLCDLGEYTAAAQLITAAQPQINKAHSLSYLTLWRLADLHEQTGDEYQKCGLPHRALTEYQSAYDLSSRAQLKMKMAESLLAMGSIERAHKELSSLLQHPECYQRALCLLGIIAYNQGDQIACAAHWRELNPDHAPAAETAALAGAYKSFAPYLRPEGRPSSTQ